MRPVLDQVLKLEGTLCLDPHISCHTQMSPRTEREDFLTEMLILETCCNDFEKQLTSSFVIWDDDFPRRGGHLQQKALTITHGAKELQESKALPETSSNLHRSSLASQKSAQS